jgi:fumarylacetoacetase
VPFGIETLPYGVFSRPGDGPRVGVAFDDQVLDLGPALGDDVFARGSLNAYMARGRQAWAETRQRIVEILVDPERAAAFLVRGADVKLHLPFEVADYVDFYSSRHHAENLGRIFRPEQPPLMPNWLRLPVGYHGRAGTVVVSGTDIRRPCGQRPAAGGGEPEFGPSARLDIEAEVGFVVGVGSDLGSPVRVDEFRDHVFGVVLLNDWSARDIQAYENVPLGPFLGKSFATSISPWVVPLDALEEAWVAPPARAPQPLPYLRGESDRGLDIGLEVRLNGEVVSRPPFSGLYWTPAQQLAHLTVNGASLRCGDLYGSGTVSGDAADERGSFIELSWNGRDPIQLSDGTARTFLEDGDVVTISATAPGPSGARVSLGETTGAIVAADC